MAVVLHVELVLLRKPLQWAAQVISPYLPRMVDIEPALGQVEFFALCNVVAPLRMEFLATKEKS